MTTEEFSRRLDKAFSKRVRLVAENSRGRFSSAWIFWGNRNDFYFGAKSLSGSLKVSLHENGRGYVGYPKEYFQDRRAAGIAIPAKTMFEWALPVPGQTGAVHAASLLLPADYCNAEPLDDRSRRNTAILGIDNGCCAEIGVFLSREGPGTLEAKFQSLGLPMFAITLENKMHVSLVARSRTFDPKCLPTSEQTARASNLMLARDDIQEHDNLNAILWDAPVDGGTLRIIDVGGVRYKRA